MLQTFLAGFVGGMLGAVSGMVVAYRVVDMVLDRRHPQVAPPTRNRPPLPKRKP